MGISHFFIKRPIFTTLTAFGILLFGIVGYRALPVAALPSVDYPTIQVQAALPGASPDTMAASVATPLERQFSTIAGIDSMNSSSSLGSTNITIQFSLDRNIDAAAQDVESAIAKAGGLLPPTMPRPPTFNKVNPSDQPVIFLGLSSDTLPVYTVDEYAETVMAQRISTVSGVSQVQVFGGQKYAVRIQLDPDRLAARGIGIDEVQAAIQANNSNLPTGKLYGAKQAFTVQSSGQLTDAAEYRQMIVTYRNGSAVRLQDLGHVLDDVENDKIRAWLNDRRTIILAVQRQPGTNTIDVVDRVKNLLPIFRSEVPPSVNLEILHDNSESIRNSIQDVKFTLLLTICLVVMVIFLFLRNISATAIPGVAVPLSIVGTFAIMYLLGYSLNNLSLMALTLSVGFVVDDAIVMLENIVRHMESGEARMEAAFRGSREIGFTILSMTISLVSVFIPVLFMGGIVGRLLHEFSVTIAVAILVSGFVSLTLTPMLASRFLSLHHDRRHNFLYNSLEHFFSGLTNLYERSLLMVLRHRLATLTVLFALLGGTVWLFFGMPKGFLPSTDSGVVNGIAVAGQDISFDSMVAHLWAVKRVVEHDPNVRSVFANAGGGNQGQIFLMLKPRNQRALSADQVIQELQPKLLTIPGIQAFLQNPPPINIGSNNTQSPYQLTLQGTDQHEIYRWVPILLDRIRRLHGFMNVTSDLQIEGPQITVDINRDRAHTLGVTADQIQNALFTAYGTRQVSTIYTPSNEYQVILEVEPQYQRNPEALSKLYVRSAGGTLVPLDTLVAVHRTVGPLSVNHYGQLPAATISFNLQPGFALGDAATAIDNVIRDLRIPPSIAPLYQGTVQAFQQSFRGLSILLIVAILVIYMVLGMLYESFIHPITILSGLPSAVFGALLTLKLFHKELDLYAFVGLIMLFGVVKKNAIMMIDFAIEAQREEGRTPFDAIFQGCILRFRPIMMTTLAALFGTFPIALGIGEGADARQPLGLAVVGGLLFSQFITLYVTPVVYLYLEALNQRFGTIRLWRRRTPAAPAVPIPETVAN
ncbi:MAG TPA: efflux RND transporter permease subunit [Bryobacteraceae bacterium]|nr:efflux RND transporter permease subunit [Bryobacteraceae bacterium]